MESERVFFVAHLIHVFLQQEASRAEVYAAMQKYASRP